MGRSKNQSVNRRDFLRTAAAGTAALVAVPAAKAAEAAALPDPHRNATAPPPRKPVDHGDGHGVEVLTIARPGSDFMVDVIKALNFEYICANPGNTFRSLHESLINYGGNKNPEFITCCHEESSVAMGHGYAKIENKPLLVAVHGTVGLQHASMAIYDAFCDRVPVVIILGNILNAAERYGQVDWAHSAQDPAAMIRDFVKWDDQPISLRAFADSAMRAYKVAMTPPMMPVALVADHELQEDPIPDGADLSVPKLSMTSPPVGDSGAVAELARLLVAAENPVIVTDRVARTAAGLAGMIELAEALQAPVVDRNGRMNFPTQPPAQSDRARRRDDRKRRPGRRARVDRFLEHGKFDRGLKSERRRSQRSSRARNSSSITANDLYLKSNYQDFQRYQPVDLAIAADAEATLPSLIEEVKRQMADDRKSAFADRGTKLAKLHEQALQQRARRRGFGLGGHADQHGARSRRSSGRRSRTRTGRSSRTFNSSAAGRCACGISTSTISTSARRAATAWAMARLRRWARRSPIASTAA